MSLDRHKVPKDTDKPETPAQVATSEHDPLQAYRLESAVQKQILAHQKNFLFLNDIWARPAGEADSLREICANLSQTAADSGVPKELCEPTALKASPTPGTEAAKDVSLKTVVPPIEVQTNEPLKQAEANTDRPEHHKANEASSVEAKPESLMRREHAHHRTEQTYEGRRHHHGRASKKGGGRRGGRSSGRSHGRGRRHHGREVPHRHKNNDDEVIEGAGTEEPPEKVDRKPGENKGAQAENKTDTKSDTRSDARSGSTVGEPSERKPDGKVNLPPDKNADITPLGPDGGKPAGLIPLEKLGKYDAKPADDGGKLVEIMKDLGKGIAGLADKVAGLIDTHNDCARGPRLTFKSLGYILPSMIATEQGKALEKSGLFKEVPRSEAREGDYAYRHWSAHVIRNHRGVDKGDSFFVTGFTKTGQLKGANDHHFLVPEDGGRYRDTKFLRPTEEFYKLYGDKLKRHSN